MKKKMSQTPQKEMFYLRNNGKIKDKKLCNLNNCKGCV